MSNVVRLEYAYGVCPKCKDNNHLRYLIRKDGLIHKPYEIKCINCNSYFTKEEILGDGQETTLRPITNADRIRSMSDDELAEWILLEPTIGYFAVCPPGTKDGDDCPTSPCEQCWLDWLKSPVRHGRWAKTIGENGVTSACRCSLCGFEDNRYSLFSFCPNCGAKMDGEA